MKGSPFSTPKPPLRDNAALHTAFAHCGVTLAEVRKRTQLDPSDTAGTLDELGQLMMFVAGNLCLPGPTKGYPRSAADDAKRWPSLNGEGQLKTLKRLMGLMTTPPTWREHGDDLPSPHKPMTPLEMGPWEGTALLPSCFGMLLILAGFGRLTGAPMLVASVQRMSAEPVAVGLRSLYGSARQLVADRLPGAFQYDTLPSALLRAIGNAEESVHLMTTRREFHGAVMIRLRDGRWVSMDPYMHNMAILDPKTQPLDQIAPRLLLDAESAATILGQGEWAERPRLEREFRMLSQLLEFAQSETLVHSAIPLLRLPDVLRDLLATYSQFEPPSVDAMLLKATTTTDVDAAREAVARAEHSPDRHIQRERILLGLFRIWAEEVWHAAQRTRNNAPHHAIMLSAPARSLAVWSLINLRHRLRSPIRAVDLLPYSGSDITLYNAIVDSKSGRITKADHDWLERRRAGFRHAPRYLLHPLILQVLD